MGIGCKFWPILLDLLLAASKRLLNFLERKCSAVQ